jgi:TetR/AcrR family transcriptional regulator, transcriptional repressor of aconitase
MPKVSEQYREARRNQILDAAKRCFVRDGFHETSMQDLFAEVGLSAGAVYRYFSSKEDMVLAIAEQSMREVIAMIHSFAAAPRSEGLGDALGNVLEVVQRKHEQDQMGAMAVLSWSEALRNPELARRFEVLIAPMRADLAEVVREHQANGDLPKHPAPEALAAVLMSIVSGFIIQLALFEAQVESGFAEAVRALWPSHIETRSVALPGRAASGSRTGLPAEAVSAEQTIS